jgi:hypothetical protein
LVISDAEMEDKGNYKVVLENDGGSADSSASLTVKLPPEPKPTIMKGLEVKTVDKGNDCAMEVEVGGKPKSVKW